MNTESQKSETTSRRILIVDDQQHIHDTFVRVFNNRSATDDGALDDFEAMFLDDDSPADRPNAVRSAADQRPDYALDHAHSGEAAVEKVRHSLRETTPYSVAFVDMRMPNGLDGLETTEAIWEIDPNVQVIICTAYSDHTWDEVLNRLGCTDRLLLLKKPFDRDEARQMALTMSEKSRLCLMQRSQVDDLESEVGRRRDAENELRVMAHRDALTSLPNRPFLLQHLDKLLSVKVDSSKYRALLFLDLDNFKIINDSLGHDAGDDLLNQVAKRLKECVRFREGSGEKSRDKTVRLGGDEFVVVLENMAQKDDAFVVARRIVKRISEPFDLDGRLVNVGTSVGVAFIDDNVQDAHQALRNADTAMYRAKNSGKGQIAVFDQTMHDAVLARHELENDLRAALENDAFQIYYQPIVDLQNGNVQGVEALLRWQKADGQFVSPMEFIPVAEEIGLISQLGEWVFETAMVQFGAMLRSLPDQIDQNIYLGVNISRRQLGDPFFLERLNKIVERTGFPRQLVKIEMTEAGDPRHDDRSLDTMLHLHDSGVGLHIDDFGKGKSSLTCFQAYPIETVKIDRSFTASITIDHGHSVITQAIVQLAHQLGAKIVCEGVESEHQLQLLRKWGCDAAQGYLFAPALDIDQLSAFLRSPVDCDGVRVIKRVPVPDLGLPINAGMSIQLT
jgi:diguanylate cyclase (GGDEF)-like protein